MRTLPLSSAICSVVDVSSVTPLMRRVTFEGAGLVGAVPIAPDQQVKLFLARDGGRPEIPEPPADASGVATWYARYLAVPEPIRPWMRAYTPRRLDVERGRMQVDFALHGGAVGPAGRWVGRARVGDEVGVLGPAVSTYRTPSGQPGRLLVGDATALPAIGAVLEALPADHHAVVVATVEDADEEQRWDSDADVTVHWVHRGGDLVDTVCDVDLPPGPVFGWVAGEASAVRAVRRHLVTDRGLAKRDVSFTGYWRRDLAQDDGPTADDTADVAELMAETS